MFFLMGEPWRRVGVPFAKLYLLSATLPPWPCRSWCRTTLASIGFLEGSVFLAFAALFPDFVIYLFFLLPVKVKWLALLAWIGYFFALVSGTWAIRLLVMASISNFLLFFSKDILNRLQIARRRMAFQASRIAVKPIHTSTAHSLVALPMALPFRIPPVERQIWLHLHKIS